MALNKLVKVEMRALLFAHGGEWTTKTTSNTDLVLALTTLCATKPELRHAE